MVQPASEMHGSASVAARIERRWGITMLAIIGVLVAITVYLGVHNAMMPPSRVETIDPATLHVSGEFAEANLGSAREPDGSVTVRIIGQQYSFTPQCIVVPAETPITFRVTSADVIHGMLVTGTNINSMVEPGFISTFKTRFDGTGDHLMPCHEFCGTGHEGMWANVRVVDRNAFTRLTDHARRASCDL
jgi:cytochrome c oxidase subunit II